MSPWSEAQTESESFERDLFARRARALPPAAVPSLETVMRAAAARREAAAAKSARGRMFVAMSLAAACMMAAITRLPHGDVRGAGPASIVPDVDAATSTAPFSPHQLASAVEDPAPAGECEDQRLALEEHVCVAPTRSNGPALFSRAETAAPPCDPNESCAPDITEAQ